MSKKDFANSPALRSPAMGFISTNAQSNVQDDVQEVVQGIKHKIPNNSAIKRKSMAINTQEDVQEVAQEYTRHRIRTQGRKGFKKPRINMAFDDLEQIRRRVEYEGKSITQFVNDIVADYLDRRK
jgi:hypothetical protein